MNVELLQYPEDPERAVATAARLCYAPVGAKAVSYTHLDVYKRQAPFRPSRSR